MADELTPSQIRRRELNELLVSLLGSRNVYFQPPDDVRMSYPAFVYKRDDTSTDYADNRPYRRQKRWEITHISGDRDDPTPDKVEELPLCSFDRHFVADKLYHNVFTLYF